MFPLIPWVGSDTYDFLLLMEVRGCAYAEVQTKNIVRLLLSGWLNLSDWPGGRSTFMIHRVAISWPLEFGNTEGYWRAALQMSSRAASGHG